MYEFEREIALGTKGLITQNSWGEIQSDESREGLTSNVFSSRELRTPV